MELNMTSLTLEVVVRKRISRTNKSIHRPIIFGKTYFYKILFHMNLK
jgi:hypothetical protein